MRPRGHRVRQTSPSAMAAPRPVLDGRVARKCASANSSAIVGPSGSGKTTLLRLVNRLIDPTAGTVRVEGDDVRSIDAVTLRRRIGYVFQGVGLFPAHDGCGKTSRSTADAARLGRCADGGARRHACSIWCVSIAKKHRDRFPRPAFRRRRPARWRSPAPLAAEPRNRLDGRAVRRARSAHPRRPSARITGGCTTNSA